MAKKDIKGGEIIGESSEPFPGVSDEQADVLIRHAAEEKKLQIKHSNERLSMLQRHAKERDAAKITLMSANGPMTAPPNPPRG